MKTQPLRLTIQLGVASAATQIEGGELNHSWNDWYARGYIHDQTNPARANDHYARFLEDISIMKEMGIAHYRLGVEWARIMPEPDRVDEDAIAYYQTLLRAMRDAGITPLLTLHHFTNPMWFERTGAFSNTQNIPIFLDFVALCVRSFGELVSSYITLNEPNVYATFGYLYGEWPPGEKSFFKAARVMSNMAACHIQAYRRIHNMRREMGYADTMVSFAHHMRVFAPDNPRNPFHRFFASITSHCFQDAVTQAFFHGKFMAPLRRPIPLPQGEYIDFIAMNYYTRSTVDKIGDGVRAGAPRTDLGWEIYPEGIVTCAQSLYAHAQKPIYITENGVCDNKDAFRAKYIFEHLLALEKSGLPVERYYHWCFCDNFEWLEGESARFGLVHVDYETQHRTIKQSGEFYARMMKEGGVTQEMIEQYISPQQYHT